MYIDVNPRKIYYLAHKHRTFSHGDVTLYTLFKHCQMNVKRWSKVCSDDTKATARQNHNVNPRKAFTKTCCLSRASTELANTKAINFKVVLCVIFVLRCNIQIANLGVICNIQAW